jgi:hypothetical protein
VVDTLIFTGNYTQADFALQADGNTTDCFTLVRRPIYRFPAWRCFQDRNDWGIFNETVI